MNYDFITIPDEDVPQARDTLFQHLVATYASETNKTASMWTAIPDDRLDFSLTKRSTRFEPSWSTRFSRSVDSSLSSSAPRNHPLKSYCRQGINPRSKPTWTSTSCWRKVGYLSLPKQAPTGG